MRRHFIKFFYLIALVFFPCVGLANKSLKNNYLKLAEDLPMQFDYTVDRESMEAAELVRAIKHINVTFKSKKPSHVDKNGKKWFERFYFSEFTYISEFSAKRAFEHNIHRYTKVKPIVTKCPYYSVRVKEKIYSISTPCYFNWKIDRLILSLKKYFISSTESYSNEIKCQSGGFCKVIKKSITKTSGNANIGSRLSNSEN